MEYCLDLIKIQWIIGVEKLYFILQKRNICIRKQKLTNCIIGQKRMVYCVI